MKMPQELHVVRCYSCQTFQVQIVKKVNKYECKMCGEKQSVKKVYAKGSGKDCRMHVQKLNQMRIEAGNQNSEFEDHDRENVECLEENFEDMNENLRETQQNKHFEGVSKWTEYVETKQNEESDCDVEDSRYTFERLKRKVQSKKQSTYNKSKKLKVSDASYISNDSLDKNAEVITEETNVSYKTLRTKTQKQNKPLKNINKSSKWDDFIVETEDQTPEKDTNVKNEQLESKRKLSKWVNSLNEHDNPDENKKIDSIIENKNIHENISAKFIKPNNVEENNVSLVGSNKNVQNLLKNIGCEQNSNVDKINNCKKSSVLSTKKVVSQGFSENIKTSKWDTFISQQSSTEGNENNLNNSQNQHKENIFSTDENLDLDNILNF